MTSFAHPALTPTDAFASARPPSGGHKPTGSFGVEPFCSSGPSPTRAESALRPATVHLIGAGNVACALLERATEIAAAGGHLVAVTDSSGTHHAPRGIDAARIVRIKLDGGRLRDLDPAEPLPTELAIDLVNAQVVIDCGPSDLAEGPRRAASYGRILARGGTVVTAAKHGLAVAADQLFTQGSATPIGIHAALGGTGQRLIRELDSVRRDARSFALVGNASTTALLQAIESGTDLDRAIDLAMARGVLEPNPCADLDGTDAALKLATVARIAFGLDLDPLSITRPHLGDQSLDPIRDRARSGLTTRLVGRITRSGEHSLQYEELPRGHALAVPSDRVGYTYRFADHERLHIGTGLGPQRTAAAVLDDVTAALSRRTTEVR